MEYKDSKSITIIAALLQSICESPESNTLSLVTQPDQNYKENVTIQVTPESIAKYNPTNVPMPIQNCKVVFYSPRIFKTFIKIDSQLVHIDQSFNLAKNWEKVQINSLSIQGGNSGAFIYMSQDNQILIKSMNSHELQLLKDHLKEYCKHLSENNLSIISKIYGLFTVTIGNDETHCFLQRNIAPCPNEYIVRKFDLKGSTVDRLVLKTEELVANADRKKTVLKDVDFLKHDEKQILTPKKYSLQLHAIIEKDAKFLQSLNIMDYSLLLIKVNWAKYTVDHNISMDQIKTWFFNDYQIIPVLKEPGYYYHMAIIDYLQLWNSKKFLESIFKPIVKDPDISSKAPQVYAERFIKQVGTIYFFGEDSDLKQQQ